MKDESLAGEKKTNMEAQAAAEEAPPLPPPWLLCDGEETRVLMLLKEEAAVPSCLMLTQCSWHRVGGAWVLPEPSCCRSCAKARCKHARVGGWVGGWTLKINAHTYRTYRNLLGKLQQVFDGEPEMLIEAVSIMESLLVHARRVMCTKLENSDETVGPVFDYEWKDLKEKLIASNNNNKQNS